MVTCTPAPGDTGRRRRSGQQSSHRPSVPVCSGRAGAEGRDCPGTATIIRKTVRFRRDPDSRQAPGGGLMAEQSTEYERSVPLALAEPSVHVKPGWIAGLGLASLGMWMASLTPIQVILPIQLQNIDNRHKIAALAIVSAVGAVASVLATPVAGALSDRTTHAYGFGGLRGRRHRWTLAMALLGAACLLLLANQRTVAGVALFWVLFSAFQNGQYASLSAAIPDHVPVRQRATVAGWVGMPQALGLVIGTVLAVL